MNSEKTDRRVKYTKLLLKESLLKLMQTYPITKISVKMLCESADINRSTFYAHFSNPYDVLKYLEREVIAEFNKYIDRYVATVNYGEPAPIIRQLLDYTGKDPDLFLVLLSDNGDSAFKKDIMSIIENQFISVLKDQEKIDGRTAEYMQCFVNAGALTILEKWLKDGMLESTQHMAELISNLLFKGISYT